MRLRDFEMPAATVNPRTPGDHARVAASKARHRLHRATVNPVTRSGWFVGVLGAILLTVMFGAVNHELCACGDELVDGPEAIVEEFGSTAHDDARCAGKLICPE